MYIISRKKKCTFKFAIISLWCWQVWTIKPLYKLELFFWQISYQWDTLLKGVPNNSCTPEIKLVPIGSGVELKPSVLSTRLSDIICDIKMKQKYVYFVPIKLCFFIQSTEITAILYSKILSSAVNGNGQIPPRSQK